MEVKTLENRKHLHLFNFVQAITTMVYVIIKRLHVYSLCCSDSCQVGLYNNRNSPITIMLLIISIITIVSCMHEIHQNAIKHSSLCCSLYAIQYLVDMQLFKTSLMLPGCFSTFLYGGGKGIWWHYQYT